MNEDTSIPSDEITRSELNNLQPAEALECVPVALLTMMIDPQADGSIVIWEIEGHKYSCHLEEYETTTLSYVRTGCANLSHIKGPHQLLIETHQQMGAELVRATIESKIGDVYYVRLEWLDRKHRRFFNICGIGDAMIYHFLAPSSKFEIVLAAVENLDSFDDEWMAQQEIDDDDF